MLRRIAAIPTVKWRGRELRISVELVPEPMHYINLRSALPEHWDEIRKTVYRRAGYRCEICGGKGDKHPVEAHELWDYDDKRHVMSLKRCIALCPTCHLCHHLGYANVSGQTEKAEAWLQRINGFSNDELRDYVEYVFNVYKRRSRYEWRLDIERVRRYFAERENWRYT